MTAIEKLVSELERPENTPTMTLTDRYDTLRDLCHVTGLTDHIVEIAIDRDGMSFVQLDTDAHVAPMLIVRDQLDKPRKPYADDGGNLLQGGSFHGIDMLFAMRFKSTDYQQGTYEERRAAALPVANAALSDLLAAIDTTTGQVA